MGKWKESERKKKDQRKNNDKSKRKKCWRHPQVAGYTNLRGTRRVANKYYVIIVGRYLQVDPIDVLIYWIWDNWVVIVLYRTICLKYPPPSYQNVLLLTRREIGGIKDAFQKVDCSNAILKFLKQQFFKYALNQRGGVFLRGARGL